MHAGTHITIVIGLIICMLAKEFVKGGSSKARTASQVTIGKIRYTKNRYTFCNVNNNNNNNDNNSF